MSATGEKLKCWRLEALKRGVHRAPTGQTIPISTHVVGIGAAGIAALAEILRSLPPGGARFHALAVGIGDQNVPMPQALVATLPSGRALTPGRARQEVAALLTSKDDTGLWETLQLLNWTAAPLMQHSAARTRWGAKWIHVLGHADITGPIGADPAAMGLLPGYKPECLKARMTEAAGADAAAAAINAAFDPDLPAQLVKGGRAPSIQFVLPSLGKADLGFCFEAQDAYDTEPAAQRPRGRFPARPVARRECSGFVVSEGGMT